MLYEREMLRRSEYMPISRWLKGHEVVGRVVMFVDVCRFLLALLPGLFFFSRRPVDAVNTAVMMKKAQMLGLDVTKLNSVPQKGCDYTVAASAAANTVHHAQNLNLIH